jgi:hypothetical protein
MKRRPYLTLFALVAGVVLTGYAAWGQQRGQPAPCCSQKAPACGPATAVGCFQPLAGCPAACATQPGEPCGAARCCAVGAPVNGKLVGDLLDILRETSSRDTFLLTVKALADIGPDAKAAVPMIIRGAERLGLSEDLEQQVKDEQGPGVMIVECIEQILRGQVCATPVPPAAWYAAPPLGVFTVPLSPPAKADGGEMLPQPPIRATGERSQQVTEPTDR